MLCNHCIDHFVYCVTCCLTHVNRVFRYTIYYMYHWLMYLPWSYCHKQLLNLLMSHSDSLKQQLRPGFHLNLKRCLRHVWGACDTYFLLCLAQNTSGNMCHRHLRHVSGTFKAQVETRLYIAFTQTIQIVRQFSPNLHACMQGCQEAYGGLG